MRQQVKAWKDGMDGLEKRMGTRKVVGDKMEEMPSHFWAKKLKIIKTWFWGFPGALNPILMYLF